MITKGPPANVFKGPILEDAPFPDVLIAKAYSADGEGLDLVLYPGKEAGKFDLGFSRLESGSSYMLGDAPAAADKDGKATFGVQVDGRTALKLSKV